MTRSPHKNLEQKSLPKDYGAGENVSEAPESINFLLLCKAGCTKDGCIPPLPNSAIKLRYMRISPLVVVILALLSCETT